MIDSQMQRRLIVRCTLAFVTAGLSAFLALALLHAHLNAPAVHAFDLGVQARVHAWSNPRLTQLMLFLSWVGSTEVFIPTLLVSLAILLAIGEREQGRRLIRKRQTSTLFAIAIGGALILNGFFKTHFHRARPRVAWSIGHEPSFSYPSGHALFSVTLYGLIAYTVLTRRSPILRRMAVAALAAAVACGIGLSRVYLGMHWPTDVLAGYITGAFCLAGAIAIDRLWRRAIVHTRVAGAPRR